MSSPNGIELLGALDRMALSSTSAFGVVEPFLPLNVDVDVDEEPDLWSKVLLSILSGEEKLEVIK